MPGAGATSWKGGSGISVSIGPPASLASSRSTARSAAGLATRVFHRPPRGSSPSSLPGAAASALSIFAISAAERSRTARMSPDDSPVATTGISRRIRSAPGLDADMAVNTGMPNSVPAARHNPAHASP